MSHSQFDNQPYNKSIFMTTHNSYRWSLTQQLDHGIRGFELDIHDSWTLFERIKRFLTLIKIFRGKGSFKIGHWYPSHEVNHKAVGNPRGNNLKDWLGVINNWSKSHPNHAPITVFLDIKKDLQDINNRPHKNFGLIQMNKQIFKAFEMNKGSQSHWKRFYPYSEYLEQYGSPGDSWPTIGELRGRILIVLMSFHIFPNIIEPLKPLVDIYGLPLMHTRQTYQVGEIEGHTIGSKCFVAFNPDDRDKEGFYPSLERDSMFITAYYPDEFPNFWSQGKIIRTDYNPKQEWPPFPPYVNFPATDRWEDPLYRDTTDKWVI
ncbi:MAG: hypothetical protein ACFFB2_10550 [Promethearchaeota archaeon]